MKYRLTKKDFYKAYLLHLKAMPITILGIVFTGVVIAVCYWFIFPPKDKSDITAAVVTLLLIIYALVMLYLRPLYTIHKSLKQTKGVGGNIDLTIQDDSFSISTENSNSTLPYKNIYKVRSNRNYMLIYLNQYFYFVLPKNNDDLANAAKSIEEKYKAVVALAKTSG